MVCTNIHVYGSEETVSGDFGFSLKKEISERSDSAAETKGILHQIEYKFVFKLCMFTKLLLLFRRPDLFKKSDSNIASV